MNTKLHFLMVLALLVMLAGASAIPAHADGVWQPVGAPGFSAGGATYISLALDNDIPYVAYQDAANGSKATVMKFNGTDWVGVGAAGFSAGAASDISLAFGNGTPFVAYTDAGNGSKATVMKFDGTGWVNVGAAGFSAGAARYVSLVFGNGTPFVAYTDAGNGSKATVMKFDGTDWSPVGAPGPSAGVAADISLAFDSGTPYVAFADYPNGLKATVMKFNGSSWENVGMPDFSVVQAAYIDLGFDNGIPYVAYLDDTDPSPSYGRKTTVMKFDGADWVGVGAPNFSMGPSYFQSLALANGTPYVAYQDVANSRRATVMKFDGTGWVSVGAPGFTTGQAWYTSLAYDNGTLYLAYQDVASGNKATVMKYNLQYNFTGFSSPVDNPNVMNIAKAGQTIPLKWRITDGSGNPITDLTSVSVTAVNMSCSTGTTTTDAIEEYAAGASGLQNLGDGYYQWNWKTPTTYANSCKILQLDLGEDAGWEHTALFQFKR